MELTKKERLALIYQLKILEALYPDERSDYALKRTALENGYELHYDWLFEDISAGLTADQCKEILDVLDMYRAITFGLQRLEPDHPLQSQELAKFRGFDGNNEGHLMAYVRYFIMDLERYEELKPGKFPTFNSHTPMLSTYREMLRRWNPIPNKYELSEQDIASVIGAS